MKFNFKYLTLPLSIMVCTSGNYSNAMDVGKEIGTNNSTINNNEKIIISNVEQEIYNHLFDENYNKEKYNSLCAECINNIKNNKPDYINLMNNTKIVFMIIKDELDNIRSSISNEENLKVPKSELPEKDVLHIIKIARQLNIFDDLKDEQDILLSDNSSDNLQKLVKGVKKRVNIF